MPSSNAPNSAEHWLIARYLEQLKPVGSFASYYLAGAAWLWAKHTYEMTHQNHIKRFYDTLSDVVLTTTSTRDFHPSHASHITTALTQSATLVMESIAATVTQLEPDEAFNFLIALASAWITRLDAACIRSSYAANNRGQMLVEASDADLSRIALHWIWNDFGDIAASDQIAL